MLLSFASSLGISNKDQLKCAGCIKKMRCWFFSEILPRYFADVGISCVNNGLLRHWLDLQNSCLLHILNMSP